MGRYFLLKPVMWCGSGALGLDLFFNLLQWGYQ